LLGLPLGLTFCQFSSDSLLFCRLSRLSRYRFVFLRFLLLSCGQSLLFFLLLFRQLLFPPLGLLLTSRPFFVPKCSYTFVLWLLFLNPRSF
jgi:hypothetical protein